MDGARLAELSPREVSEGADRVDVVLAEVVNVCSDIVVLLYLGCDNRSGRRVAGIWCPECESIYKGRRFESRQEHKTRHGGLVVKASAS